MTNLYRNRGIISIHAPTRGATSYTLIPLPHFLFQSTLLQEERLYVGAESANCSYFNPRSYKRSDEFEVLYPNIETLFQSTLLQEERLVAYVKNISNYLISIHAPTRGATALSCNKPLFCVNFNPRSYKRSDGKNAQLSLYLSVIIIA